MKSGIPGEETDLVVKYIFMIYQKTDTNTNQFKKIKERKLRLTWKEEVSRRKVFIIKNPDLKSELLYPPLPHQNKIKFIKTWKSSGIVSL